MDNSYEIIKKDINEEENPQNLQMQELLLFKKYQEKFDTELSFYSKERDLANNIDNQIERISKIKDIDSDYLNRTKRLYDEYEKELKDLKEKFEEADDYPYYYKWIYLGPVNKYNGLINGLAYYIKVENPKMIRVFADVEYKKFFCKIGYVPEEWLAQNNTFII